MCDDKHEHCDEVERTILIQKQGKLELTFPSLYGTDCCLAKYDESEGVWQICVNPFSQLFEPRTSMKLKTGSLVRIPRKKSHLDFGWRNYEFSEQDFFKRAGTTTTVHRRLHFYAHKREAGI
jgi:hypothetical protein